MSNPSMSSRTDSSPRKTSIFSSPFSLSHSTVSSKKHDELRLKIEEVTKQIQKLRHDRQILDEEKRSLFSKKVHGKVQRPQTSSHPPHNSKEQIYNRIRMSHPNLEYVIAEVSMSPYLTDPVDNYPISNLKTFEKIRDLRQKGLKYEDVPKAELPFDYEKVRDTFVNEILQAQAFRIAEFRPQRSIFSASAPGSAKVRNFLQFHLGGYL